MKNNYSNIGIAALVCVFFLYWSYSIDFYPMYVALISMGILAYMAFAPNASNKKANESAVTIRMPHLLGEKGHFTRFQDAGPRHRCQGVRLEEIEE